MGGICLNFWHSVLECLTTRFDIGDAISALLMFEYIPAIFTFYTLSHFLGDSLYRIRHEAAWKSLKSIKYLLFNWFLLMSVQWYSFCDSYNIFAKRKLNRMYCLGLHISTLIDTKQSSSIFQTLCVPTDKDTS